MAITALLTGSNIGGRKKSLHYAETEIGRLVVILKKSHIYESSAWGKTNQAAFLNQCIVVETKLAPLDLLHRLKDIEKQAGRVKTEKWGERVLDIDILFYDGLVMDAPELIIPHPYIAERRFTLVPLAEIAADWVHPLLHKTANKLLVECIDKGEVKSYELR